jgi:hypothetical protein
MDKKLFNELTGSVKEAGKIRRGQKNASRFTAIKAPVVRKIRKTGSRSRTR